MSTTKTRRITDKQKLFVDYLPEHDWNYVKAALAAGYTHNYATKNIHGLVKSNIGLARLIDDKRREISGQTQDKREKAERIYWSIIDDPHSKPATVLKALDGVSSISGWKQSTITLEPPTRQAALDKAHQEELARITAERNRRSLPAGDVTIYDSPRGRGDIVAGHGDIGHGASSETPPGRPPVTPHADEAASYPSEERKFSEKPPVKQPEYNI